ncbi:sirohydrochlorin cobaltochelatase [Lacrimispora saccharolytica]|uniref:Sirohydrochlorin cobaltochelatase n=1 Tax=Lacrimispora saccharolytica (strain ATCC 35040 / DSM 2544 / NRCC 2533 / WM1) TaxID=610130 RepID=D9R604_LACSW|nr:sirohydrochlorin cobaltochelatase [Lacrimispora saccharolytica]ADL03438.1 Sirohydrochlorin cobaltochelatase [[Clostridium] saccharolyticum WM1]
MKQAILVVSFGTSYHDSREKTIEAIEQDIKETFTKYEVRRAFTSRIIIGILKKRDNIYIDSVDEALEKLAAEGFERVIVQPTLVMGGEEYDTILAAVKQYENRFRRIVCGKPLLSEEEDFKRLIRVMAEDTKEYDREGTEILFMGHGTEHEANVCYSRLKEIFRENGYGRYHVGTVEAEPGLKTVKEEVKKTDSSRIVLQPLMIVCGDHAHNDMAGEDKDTWKSQLESEGYQVVCRLKGMGELEGVRRLFLDHAGEARKRLEAMG